MKNLVFMTAVWLASSLLTVWFNGRIHSCLKLRCYEILLFQRVYILISSCRVLWENFVIKKRFAHVVNPIISVGLSRTRWTRPGSLWPLPRRSTLAWTLARNLAVLSLLGPPKESSAFMPSASALPNSSVPAGGVAGACPARGRSLRPSGKFTAMDYGH